MYILYTYIHCITYTVYLGNMHHDACNFSPGSSPRVINVGSTKMEHGKDQLSNKTNYGACVSLYAPGQYK